MAVAEIQQICIVLRAYYKRSTVQRKHGHLPVHHISVRTLNRT